MSVTARTGCAGMMNTRNVLEPAVGIGRPVKTLGGGDPAKHAAEAMVVVVLHKASEVRASSSINP